LELKKSLKDHFTKDKLNHLSSLVLVGLLIFVLVRQGPSILNRFNQQGKSLKVIGEVQDINGQRWPFPFAGQHVLVFWATWCGPCKVELSRLKSLVQSGQISGEQIHAISIGEPLEKVVSFQKENQYPFSIYIDPQYQIADGLEVAVTPTVLLVDEKSQVSWWTSGLSPSLEWRVKRHLGARQLKIGVPESHQ
jgi:cytochrome c biogenesis protein CcmG, thiol:disulfide interchange protein DsbE